jgi:hypothetical protein
MPKSKVNDRGGRIGSKASRALWRECRRRAKKRANKKFPVVAEKYDIENETHRS